MQRLAGRKGLVTGGGRGIGTAIVRRLVAEGAHVAFTYNQSASAAEQLCEDLRQEGGTVLVIKADAADSRSASDMVEQAADQLGGLNLLVNNAALNHVGPLDEVTEGQIQEMLDVNVRAVVLACRSALAHLPDDGRIISIGSALADRAFAGGLATYALTKAALSGFTRALARELGPRGINVNIIHPGNTATDMNPPDHPRAEWLLSLTALGRYNDPEDVAAAVAFLASPDARQITGASLSVDAGMNA